MADLESGAGAAALPNDCMALASAGDSVLIGCHDRADLVQSGPSITPVKGHNTINGVTLSVLVYSLEMLD